MLESFPGRLVLAFGMEALISGQNLGFPINESQLWGCLGVRASGSVVLCCAPQQDSSSTRFLVPSHLTPVPSALATSR